MCTSWVHREWDAWCWPCCPSVKVAPLGGAGHLCGHELAPKEATEPEADGPSVGTPRVAKSQFTVPPRPPTTSVSSGCIRHTSRTGRLNYLPSFWLVFAFVKFHCSEVLLGQQVWVILLFQLCPNCRAKVLLPDVGWKSWASCSVGQISFLINISGSKICLCSTYLLLIQS